MADLKNIEEGNSHPEKLKPEAPASNSRNHERTRDEEVEAIADSSKKQKLETPNEIDEKSFKLKNSKSSMEEEDEEEDDEEYCEAEEDEVEEESQIVDRKGKGKMVDVKGKGKMVEEDDSDDDSSDCSDSDFSDGLDDSDMEDDPLAEVDLDNILPSRTRQRGAMPGLRISDHQDKAPNA